MDKTQSPSRSSLFPSRMYLRFPFTQSLPLSPDVFLLLTFVWSKEANGEMQRSRASEAGPRQLGSHGGEAGRDRITQGWGRRWRPMAVSGKQILEISFWMDPTICEGRLKKVREEDPASQLEQKESGTQVEESERLSLTELMPTSWLQWARQWHSVQLVTSSDSLHHWSAGTNASSFTYPCIPAPSKFEVLC